MPNLIKIALCAAIILSTAFSALTAAKLELTESRQAGQARRAMIETAVSSRVATASDSNVER